MDHPTYPTWVLDDSPIDDPEGRGEHVVRFFNSLRHSKSTEPNNAFILPRFWERILRRIYGPVNDRGQRLTRQVFIMIPRGARKTTIAGGLGLYHTAAREVRVPRGQVLLAAASKEQAFFAFREARDFAMTTPGFVTEGNSPLLLRGAAKQTAEDPYIMHAVDQTTLSVRSSDGDLSHGTTPNVVIYDELHVFKRRNLWDALQSGRAKEPNTLSIVITTAGRGQSGLAWDEYQYAKKVAKGEIVNPFYLPVIFEPPSADSDWRDRNLWDIVMPGLSEGFPDIDGLEEMALKAAGDPGELEIFKQYQLNFWMAQSTSPFIDINIYDEGADPVHLDDHEAMKTPCWIGVDLGFNDDLSAIVVAWPAREGEDDISYEVWPYFFCPQETIEKRGDSDSAKYRQWVSDGFMTATSGHATSFPAIKDKIIELCKRFNVQEVAFDPKFATVMISDLIDQGIPAVTMAQNWSVLAEPTKETHRALISRRLSHGGHPVLRWNFENVEAHIDSAGNRVMHKGKSRDKIDGAVATMMAVGRAYNGSAADAEPVPFYLQEGFDPERALGISVDKELSEEDRAAAAARDADIDRQVRKMLGMD